MIAEIFGALFLCCASLTLLSGDIGFQGDDWWILSWPFWHGFRESLWLYAKASLRPLEGLYWISIFKMFGFHREVFQFLSLLLSAGACTAMGACLLRAFPERRDFVVLSAFFAFFLPTVSPLTYLIHTDNSRLALLFFWTSALFFQRWAAGSGSWSGLVAPVLLYCLAVLTYENGAFLIFAVPMIVWPVYVRSGRKLSESGFLLRVAVAVFGAFSLFVFIRFMLFSGGAVGHRSLMPSFSLSVGYVSSLALYLAAPFSRISSDVTAWLWGACVAALTGGLLFFRDPRTLPVATAKPSGHPGALYVAALGALVLALGVLPYILAGYTAELGFTSQSRVYSSGTFGLAMLIALFATFWKSRKVLATARVLSIVAVLLMAVFMADLKNDWRHAAQLRRALCAQLLEQVPNVEAGTTFLFLNLQSYVSNRAVVFQGTDGLNEFVKMLYNKKSVYAYFLYPHSDKFNDVKGKTAAIDHRGIVPRGRLSSDPIPLDTLLILQRTGSKLALVNGISCDEELAAATWKGISSIRSDVRRILPGQGIHDTFREMCLK